MTYGYIQNACALFRNVTFDGSVSYNIQGFRKGLFVQLFCMYLFYFFTQILQTFRYRSDEKKVQIKIVQQSGKQQQLMQQKTDPRPDLPWHERRWNRTFTFLFAFHSVALGMCMLFSPFAGSLVVAYLHLLIFAFYVGAELSLKKLPANVLRILLDLLDLVLLLIGTVGINYAQFNNLGYCN